MSRLPIDIGSAINAGDGEAIRNAFGKVNTMMEEVYSILIANGVPASFLPDNSLSDTKLALMAANTIKANVTNAPAAPQNAPYSAIAAAIGIAPLIVPVSSGYTVVAADIGKIFLATGTFTLSTAAAATVGNGFNFRIRNAGTGIVTIDPNASETIEGAATTTVFAAEDVLVVSDGTNWRIFGRRADIPLASGSVTSVAQLDLALPEGYREFRFSIQYAEPSAAALPNLRFSGDGGTTYESGATAYVWDINASVAGGAPLQFDHGDLDQTRIALSAFSQPAATYIGMFGIDIFPGDGTKRAGINFKVGGFSTAPNPTANDGAGMRAANGRVTNVRFFYGAANIASAYYTLTGRR